MDQVVDFFLSLFFCFFFFFFTKVGFKCDRKKKRERERESYVCTQKGETQSTQGLQVISPHVWSF